MKFHSSFDSRPVWKQLCHLILPLHFPHVVSQSTVCLYSLYERSLIPWKHSQPEIIFLLVSPLHSHLDPHFMRTLLLNTIQRNQMRLFDFGKRFGRILSIIIGMGQDRAQSKCIQDLEWGGGTVQRKVSIQVAFFFFFFAISLFHQGLPKLAWAVWLESAYTSSMALQSSQPDSILT